MEGGKRGRLEGWRGGRGKQMNFLGELNLSEGKQVLDCTLAEIVLLLR